MESFFSRSRDFGSGDPIDNRQIAACIVSIIGSTPAIERGVDLDLSDHFEYQRLKRLIADDYR
jgi:hypothetical protein